MKKQPVRKVSSQLIKNLLKETTPSEKRRVEDAMRLATNIAAYMKKQGLNNTKLIDRLKEVGVEVQPSMVSRWLSGTHNFTQNTLSDIALALNVEIAELHARPKSKDDIVFTVEGMVYNKLANVEKLNNWVKRIGVTPNEGFLSTTNVTTCGISSFSNFTNFIGNG